MPLPLKTLHSVSELRRVRADLAGSVGFVPTMGALHQGHADLMKRAVAECDSVVASIFVNPTQFGPQEDFAQYPRTLEADLDLCGSVGVEAVWVPTVEDIYPAGAQTVVDVEQLGNRFEGESRPGHFRGVATVVSKLFHVVRPHKAFFGEKDLQQLFVIKRLVKDLLFDIEIVGVPTVREESGLALSSRNSYLSTEERLQARQIYQSLQAVREAYRNGCRVAAELEDLFVNQLALLQAAKVERFDLFDPHLSHRYQGEETVDAGYCAVVVRYGGVRLLDNISLCC